ncbi:MAG: class I SAM-dependent methyltransferase [Pseudomonadales bacterium]|nr:class I SAM-dependent methyltransferase [Pseudomonadales bacterium]
MLGLLSKKKSTELWDDEYKNGRWDYLREQPLYNNSDFIAGYLNRETEGTDATIFDVGAGNGALYPLLTLKDEKQYFPVDVSQVALDALKESHNITNSMVGDIETMDLSESNYDYIVLNEVVYYFNNPIQTVKRCAEAAKKCCIVSMYHSPRSNLIIMFLPRPTFSARINGEYKWTIMFYLK